MAAQAMNRALNSSRQLQFVTTLLALLAAAGCFIGQASAQEPVGGYVWVDVTVDASGHVTDADLIDAPDPLSQPIKRWVEQRKFEPALIDGVSVESTTPVQIKYLLEEVETGYAVNIVDYQSKPRPLRQIQPKYPGRAQRKKMEGYVKIQFTVNPDGFTENIRVLESSHTTFVIPTVKAIEQWRFKVKTAGDHRIGGEFIQQINYRLGGGQSRMGSSQVKFMWVP